MNHSPALFSGLVIGHSGVGKSTLISSFHKVAMLQPDVHISFAGRGTSQSRRYRINRWFIWDNAGMRDPQGSDRIVISIPIHSSDLALSSYGIFSGMDDRFNRELKSLPDFNNFNVALYVFKANRARTSASDILVIVYSTRFRLMYACDY